MAQRSRALSANRVGSRLLAVIPVVFLGVLFVWPVAALVWRAITDSADAATGSSLTELFTRTRAAHLLWVTVAQAAASTALSLVVAAPIVWLYSRLRGASAMVLDVVVTVPFVLPTVVVGVAFRALIDGPLAFAHIGSGWWAVLLAHAFLNVAVVVRVVGAAWRSLDTRALDAARTLGAGRFRAWRTVIAPALLPAVGAAGTLIFLFCSTSFGVIIILGGGTLRTLETEIYQQAIGYFRIPEAVALSLVQILVVVVALILTRVVTARSRTTTKGTRAPRHRRITGWARVSACLAWVWTVAVLIVPIAVLAVRSVRPSRDGAWTLSGYRALAEPVNGVTPLATLRYSLVSALLAMMIAVAVGALAAVALHNARGTARVVGAVLALIPLGISAVTLGFGYLIVLSELPGRIAASELIIPCVQALIAIPVVIGIVVPALDAVPDRARAAAATLGAGPLRVFCTIDLPAIGRSLAAAAGFAFVMALGEFGATSFLARADTTTLPVLIGSALNRPGATQLATAMAASMLLVVATAVAMLAVELLRPRSGAPI
ncbi:ABC transporter permease [Gordonia otitidis]|uniref:ABC transporter permease protein n=1 Tax=Gordonia otitidis (strain DSM 44809 / CCUG 52243 / JCM 12355 / NBRC 100426 / IFM 10032) TaxID=1108044 RepID=H5TMA1_GORO1|nr:iron ABC transporter permease [Gordonia otitidis]GAB34609.1 putative ABC transporter permease protein [Gordonia otitidis NBRC 100426]